MKKQNKKERGIIALLLVCAVFMTVGFANYVATLNIEGDVTVKTNKWEIAYDTATYVETENSAKASAKTIDATKFDFTVELTKPGDFYEATVNVKNGGTFDAELNKITMSTLDAAQQKYLTYTVTYGGTTYSATTEGLKVALAAGASTPVKVRVEYVAPANSAELPQTDTTVTVTGQLDYSLAK